jgi:hypothetical protein
MTPLIDLETAWRAVSAREHFGGCPVRCPIDHGKETASAIGRAAIIALRYLHIISGFRYDKPI